MGTLASASSPKAPVKATLTLIGSPKLGEEVTVRWAGTPDRDMDSAQVVFAVQPLSSGSASLAKSEPRKIDPTGSKSTNVTWSFRPDAPGRYRVLAGCTLHHNKNQFARDESLLIEVTDTGPARIVPEQIMTAKQFTANAIWQDARGTDAPTGFDPDRDRDPRSIDFKDSKLPKQTGAFTVKGTINYTDRLYTGSNGGAFSGTTIRPARRVDVSVVDVESGGKVDHLVSTKTNAFGAFSVTIPNNIDGVGEGTRDIRLHVNASNEACAVISAGGTYYQYRSPTFYDWPGGTLDFGTRNITQSASGPFSIADTILQGRDYVIARGESGKFVYVKWAVGNEAQIGTSAFYSKSENGGTIYLTGGPTNPDEFDDDVILHEYGHLVLHKYSFDKSPGGSHTWFTGTNAKLAWSEGWASFFNAAVRNTRYYVDHTAMSQGVVNLETIHLYAQGDTVEGAVAGSLYDIFDTSSDSPDALSDGITRTWHVMTNYYEAASPCDVRDFYDGWKANAFANQTQVNTILKRHGIDYTSQRLDFPSNAIMYHDTNSFIWWSGFLGAKVKINVYKDDAFHRTIANSVNNNGAWDFYVDPDLYPVSTKYSFAVFSSPSATQWAVSEDFCTITDAPQDLTHGGAVEGIISHGFDIDHYMFNLLGKKSVTIDTTAGTNDDVVMRLYGPNSQVKLLAQDDDSGAGAMARIVRTLNPGTYYIEIEGFNTTDVGTYNIQVIK